ncbi:hypothetical protein N431DRAFT_444716 [Stipitochalara longipes BDJ]|nr:hypothetical protein N431DRAFT_444716 [Stipitochalara longipes BDJ]
MFELLQGAARLASPLIRGHGESFDSRVRPIFPQKDPTARSDRNAIRSLVATGRMSSLEGDGMHEMLGPQKPFDTCYELQAGCQWLDWASPNFDWRSLICAGGEKPISFRPISSHSSGTQRLRTSQSAVPLVSGAATPDVDPPTREARSRAPANQRPCTDNDGQYDGLDSHLHSLDAGLYTHLIGGLGENITFIWCRITTLIFNKGGRLPHAIYDSIHVTTAGWTTLLCENLGLPANKPWMSVLASFTDGGGSATVTLLGRQLGFPPFPSGFPFPPGLPFPSSFLSFPSPPTVTTTQTIIPAIEETTILTLATSTDTTTTTTATLATNTNIVSTATQTSISFSVTGLPNPAATAGLAQANMLLMSNATLAKTNITVSLVLGILTFLLLVIIVILVFLYFRRRRKSVKSTDDESPPFTSLAPRPAPFPMITQSAPQLPPQRPERESMQETSLSMGPRGGTADSYNRALREAQARATDALNSHPLTRPSRSFSAPVNAPEPAPSIPPFDMGLPSINIMPTTPASSRRARTADDREARSPSPITPPPNVQQPPLRRNQPTLQRVPMYHAALQEQAQRQRQSAMAATAGRLGLPIIQPLGRGRTEERESAETMGTEVSGYDDNGGSRERSGEGGMGISKGGTSRTPILHSTRASSGVFPEGARNDSEEDEEFEKMLAAGGVGGGNGGNGGGNGGSGESGEKGEGSGKGKGKEKEKDES